LPTTDDVLRAIPLFQGMTDRSIDVIGGLARPVAYGVGETLVRQGQSGDSFIVITAGTADVVRDGATVRSLGPGDFLGEVSLFDGGERTASVTATSAVEGLSIDRAGFDRLMSEFPVVRHDVVAALSHRLRARGPSVTD
jgi:CRP/FNR family transcriptional regulator, cyclic AMP receptor protein